MNHKGFCTVRLIPCIHSTQCSLCSKPLVHGFTHSLCLKVWLHAGLSLRKLNSNSNGADTEHSHEFGALSLNQSYLCSKPLVSGCTNSVCLTVCTAFKVELYLRSKSVVGR